MKAGWGVWKFMQIYFSPNTMLVIDLRKIKTCSPLICIICPVCLVKGFSRRETFHSRSAKKNWFAITALLTLTDAFGCLSVCLLLWLCVLCIYLCLVKQIFCQWVARQPRKNQVKIFENWFCRRTWQRQTFNELRGWEKCKFELEVLFIICEKVFG